MGRAKRAGEAERPPKNGETPKRLSCRARKRAGRAERPPKKGETPNDLVTGCAEERRNPERLRCRARREGREALQERSREGLKAPQERPDPESRTTKVANQQTGGKGRVGRKAPLKKAGPSRDAPEGGVPVQGRQRQGRIPIDCAKLIH